MLNYENIGGWFSPKDVETYRRLIDYLPDNSVICELGSWKGRSICSVADIILKKNLFVNIVDTFEGTENEGDAHKEAKQVDLCKEFFETTAKFGLDKANLVVYKCTTDEAFEKFKELKHLKFDFIFIDADHSTEAVTKDIQNYSQLLRNENSILAGHDLSWQSVQKAIENCIEDINTMTHNGENLWWFEPQKVTYKKNISTNFNGVTAVVCTKDRYPQLYNTLLCIQSQRISPKDLFIYDDSDNKIDIKNIYEWQSLWNMLETRGINVVYKPTNNHGQNKNHQDSVITATTKYIWRVDDDLIFGPNVLYELFSTISLSPKIGAVGPRVSMPNNNTVFEQVSGKMQDIFTKPGIQLSISGEGQHEVEHLHCTFLYDRTLGASYHPDLSQVGHREETIFSHNIFKLGYKLIVDLNVNVFHLKCPSGGIRSEQMTAEMFVSDEHKFKDYLNDVTVVEENVPAKLPFYYLNNGIGDHLAFKQLLPELFLTSDNLLIACVYPEVFWDIQNIQIISLEEGKKIIAERGETEKDYSVYEVMQNSEKEFRGNGNYILQAYRKLYL